jgi:hypothetical protein
MPGAPRWDRRSSGCALARIVRELLRTFALLKALETQVLGLMPDVECLLGSIALSYFPTDLAGAIQTVPVEVADRLTGQ